MTKTYYYKITSKKSRSVGGFNVVASVYEVKAGKIHEIGEVKWNTSAFKGEKSAVYDFLKDKKLVSVKEHKDNGGYYYPSKSKVAISEL